MLHPSRLGRLLLTGRRQVAAAHRMALRCWRHCPPAMVAPDAAPDATDQLGPPPGGPSKCGRHCGKMLRVTACLIVTPWSACRVSFITHKMLRVIAWITPRKLYSFLGH